MFAPGEVDLSFGDRGWPDLRLENRIKSFDRDGAVVGDCAPEQSFTDVGVQDQDQRVGTGLDGHDLFEGVPALVERVGRGSGCIRRAHLPQADLGTFALDHPVFHADPVGSACFRVADLDARAGRVVRGAQTDGRALVGGHDALSQFQFRGRARFVVVAVVNVGRRGRIGRLGGWRIRDQGWPTQPEPMAAARAFRGVAAALRVPTRPKTQPAVRPGSRRCRCAWGTGTSTGSRLEITRPSTRTFVGSLKTNFLPAVSSAGRSTAEARARCATTYVPALRSTVVRGTPASTAGTGHCTESLVTWGESSTVASKDGFCAGLDDRIAGAD